MEILYKKDSKGKILQWSAAGDQNVLGVTIQIKAGELNGKITTTLREGIQGKNIGKANETSPLTQAEQEVQSLYKRKKRQGYKSLTDLKYPIENEAFGVGIELETWLQLNLKFDTTDLDGNLKPMKAQQYYRSKKNWTDPTGKVWDDRKYYYLLNPDAPKEKGALIMKFPCLIQPKINGIRCTISLDELGKVQILSKEGLRYNLPHIEQEFQNNIECFTFKLEKEGEIDVIFDGELYIHGEKLQTISSAVKAQNLNTSRVKFICFDLAIPKLNNLSRIQLMKSLLSFKDNNLLSSIDYVSTHKIAGDQLAQTMTDKYIEEGYEGSILRNINGLYAFGKRPMDMVKLKRVLDEEYKILDIISQDKNPNLGLFVCQTKEGKEFKVTPKGTEDFKQLILFQKHLFVGKPLTCTFYEYTEDGIPFHIIDNIVRDYE